MKSEKKKGEGEGEGGERINASNTKIKHNWYSHVWW